MIRRLFPLLGILFLSVPGVCFAANDSWSKLVADHFILFSDADPNECTQLMEQFESSSAALELIFPTVNVNLHDRLVVVAARNEKSFQLFLPPDATKGDAQFLYAYFLPSHPRSFILLRLNAKIDTKDESLFLTLYRAYDEIQFSTLGTSYPLWVKSGLAEVAKEAHKASSGYEIEPLDTLALKRLHERKLLPLQDMLKLDENSTVLKTKENRELFDAESALLVRLLIARDRAANSNKLFDYIKLTSKHENPVNAAQSIFSDLISLERELEQSAHSSQSEAIQLGQTKTSPAINSPKVESLSADELAALKADEIGAQGRFDESERQIDELLKHSANLPAIYEARASNALRQKKTDVAKQWFSQAIQHGEADPHILYRYAELVFSNDHGKDAQVQAAAALEKAIALNPNLPQVYDLAAVVDLQSTDKTADAFQKESRAIELDPFTAHYHMTLAGIRVIQGKLDAALAEYQKARSISESKDELAKIDDKIKVIQKYQSATPPPQISEATQPKHHLTEPAAGPQHEVDGILRTVVCSYPSVMDLQLETPEKKYKLYHFNYFKVDFSAEEQSVADHLEPCHTIEGMKAHVVFAEDTDKTADGQLVSILLKQ